MSVAYREAIKSQLYQLNKISFDTFFESIRNKLDRLVERIVLTPLYGIENVFFSMSELKSFLDYFNEQIEIGSDFRKYEIRVEFSNRDKINGEFQSKERVIEFLKYVIQ